MRKSSANKKQIFVFVGLVKNKKGEVLLIKREEKELPKADNKWELPGGKVHFGETPEEALKRETLEETGFQVEPLKLLAHPFVSLWRYPDFIQQTIIFCFKCQLKSESPLHNKKDHHVQETKWVNEKDLDKYQLLPGVGKFISNER